MESLESMLASSFFFGRNIREKREKEQNKLKQEFAAIRLFKSDFMTEEYSDWSKLS